MNGLWRMEWGSQRFSLWKVFKSSMSFFVLLTARMPYFVHIFCSSRRVNDSKLFESNHKSLFVENVVEVLAVFEQDWSFRTVPVLELKTFELWWTKRLPFHFISPNSSEFLELQSKGLQKCLLFDEFLLKNEGESLNNLTPWISSIKCVILKGRRQYEVITTFLKCFRRFSEFPMTWRMDKWLEQSPAIDYSILTQEPRIMSLRLLLVLFPRGHSSKKDLNEVNEVFILRWSLRALGKVMLFYISF